MNDKNEEKRATRQSWLTEAVLCKRLSAHITAARPVARRWPVLRWAFLVPNPTARCIDRQMVGSHCRRVLSLGTAQKRHICATAAVAVQNLSRELVSRGAGRAQGSNG